MIAFAARFERLVGTNWRRFMEAGQPTLWLLALAVGLSVCLAAILFHFGIDLIQTLWLGTGSEAMLAAAETAPWWRVMAGPVIGGLVVGLLITHLLPQQRTSSIADVVEARAEGRDLPLRAGLASALVTVISLGAGASAGREGPIVHLGGTVAVTLGRLAGRGRDASRVLIAAGAASAIAASFNTPLAGVLFAHEVVLGNYALSNFVPVVIAAAAAVVPARLVLGADPYFAIPAMGVESLTEFPAFALLGLVCGVVGVLFQWMLVGGDLAARRLPLPLWLRPVIGGLAIGALGLVLPDVLGIGGEAVDRVLHSDAPELGLLVALVAAKAAATAIILASRFGGGIVFPSIYLGAMTGTVFGILAGAVFPDQASAPSVYAVVGMAALPAAVLGAPISTAVMIYELTGGFQLSIALLLAVAMANAATDALHGRSLIDWQLEMRGILLHGGPGRHTMRRIKVSAFMSPVEDGDAQLPADYPPGTLLRPGDSLGAALKIFDTTRLARIAVVDPAHPGTVLAWASHVAALAAFNAALLEESR